MTFLPQKARPTTMIDYKKWYQESRATFNKISTFIAFLYTYTCFFMASLTLKASISIKAVGTAL